MITKKELRQMIRQRKKEHSVDESSFVIERLRENRRFADAHTLLLYSALPDEVQTQQLIDELTAEGKLVVLPKVTGETEMELRHYTGSNDLEKGAFGILEPTGELFTDDGSIDVAVIPGMAFDTAGHRLGRGKGYYDRMLSRMPEVYKIGICFPWQIVDEVPSDEHDIVMDCVISRSGCQ